MMRKRNKGKKTLLNTETQTANYINTNYSSEQMAAFTQCFGLTTAFTTSCDC